MEQIDLLRATAALATAALLAACASGPPPGGLAWVGLDGPPRPAELHAAAAALRSAGISEADIAAGRVWRATCSPSIDATWSTIVVLPQGQHAEQDQVLRVRTVDIGDNARLGVNITTGAAEPALPARLRAYSGNTRIELEPPRKGRYREVQGSYIVAC